jgi:hypothetical protein
MILVRDSLRVPKANRLSMSIPKTAATSRVQTKRHIVKIFPGELVGESLERYRATRGDIRCGEEVVFVREAGNVIEVGTGRSRV